MGWLQGCEILEFRLGSLPQMESNSMNSGAAKAFLPSHCRWNETSHLSEILCQWAGWHGCSIERNPQSQISALQKPAFLGISQRPSIQFRVAFIRFMAFAWRQHTGGRDGFSC